MRKYAVIWWTPLGLTCLSRYMQSSYDYELTDQLHAEPLENEPTKCVGEKDDVKADTCPVYASPDDLGVEGNTCDDNVHRLTDAGPQADQVPSTSAPGTGCGVGGLAAVSGCEI